MADNDQKIRRLERQVGYVSLRWANSPTTPDVRSREIVVWEDTTADTVKILARLGTRLFSVTLTEV